MSREIEWRRVLVEAIVIVGSILVAFGVDALWAIRNEQLLEREELRRVRAELLVERERLLGSQERQQARAAASLELVVQIEALSRSAGTIVAADSLLALIAGSPSFEAQTPALDGLLRSGSFSVIDDTEVREAIAHLEDRLASAARQLEGTAAVMTEQVIPALIQRGDMSHVLLNSRGTARLRLERSVTELRADPQLKALLAYRHVQAIASRDRLREVGIAMDRVVAAIEADGIR